MAKDYFQDITPPSSAGLPRPEKESPSPSVNQVPRSETLESASLRSNGGDVPADVPERTIRNIQVSTTRPKPRMTGGEIREAGAPPPQKRYMTRFSLWGAVALAVLVLGAVLLVAFRPTTVTVTPRSHTVLFDETALFSAYPVETAASGTLSFTTEKTTLEDSQVVSTQGKEHAEERASGTITVFNEYSSKSVKLIKNTRFESPDGLIFRVPAEVIVPGKKGARGGEISITIFADAPGEKYNVGPTARFTVPGLKTSPDMYGSVYGRSTAALAGGFVGDRPAAPPGAVESARAEIRSRLQGKAVELARARNNEKTVAFVSLARITFESSPITQEAGNGIRVHERAHVELPIFPADEFTYIVARSVSAEAERGSITLMPGATFSARASALPVDPTGPAALQFSLEGTAQLIWKVDTIGLATALAGRSEAAFQTIVEGFDSIKEARARTEPFWSDSFPTDPAKIKIKVEEPKPTQ